MWFGKNARKRRRRWIYRIYHYRGQVCVLERWCAWKEKYRSQKIVAGGDIAQCCFWGCREKPRSEQRKHLGTMWRGFRKWWSGQRPRMKRGGKRMARQDKKHTTADTRAGGRRGLGGVTTRSSHCSYYGRDWGTDTTISSLQQMVMCWQWFSSLRTDLTTDLSLHQVLNTSWKVKQQRWFITIDRSIILTHGGIPNGDFGGGLSNLIFIDWRKSVFCSRSGIMLLTFRPEPCWVVGLERQRFIIPGTGWGPSGYGAKHQGGRHMSGMAWYYTDILDFTGKYEEQNLNIVFGDDFNWSMRSHEVNID